MKNRRILRALIAFEEKGRRAYGMAAVMILGAYALAMLIRWIQSLQRGARLARRHMEEHLLERG